MVRFIPHRCGTAYITLSGKPMELTTRGYETCDADEIEEIKKSPLFGIWLKEDVVIEEEEEEELVDDDHFDLLRSVPVLAGLDANDIMLEEAFIAEQKEIREEQARQERIDREISMEVDEGIKREMRNRKPGGKNPAGGKSKKTEPKKDEAPKKRGRPPKVQ
jgi:hypothetical protein